MTQNIQQKTSQLPVMEIFYSIQGEGHHQGKPAHFIRLGGCDVGCHWCDVKESWDASLHPTTEIGNIIQALDMTQGGIVVVTGGEPAMYNLDGLTKALKEMGARTHLETSGAYPITGSWDWICLSPKKFKPPVAGNLHLADELKVIVYNRSDFDWGVSYANQVRKDCKLFFQPEWGKRNEVTAPIVEYVKQNPRWAISLQIHKYLDVP